MAISSRSHHAPATHGRLHRRGNSASSITSPSSLSPLSDGEAFTFNRSETPKVTYEEPWLEPKRPMPSATSSHPLKIKPYLRKLSSKDNNSLDLSRPAAENQGLAGLGISDFNTNNTTTTGPYSVSDVNFAPINPRNRHHRSTSNTSQFSTASSLQRPAAPYMPAIRQTRPYTPPVSNSTPPSVLGTDSGVDDIMSDDEFRARQNAFDPSRRSGSISSTPGVASTLRIHTTGSSTRLGGSYSPSTVSLTSPIAQARSRGDTLKSIDTTTSPSARTSIDKAFGFIRPGRDSPVDPTSRADKIRQARQAFNEKERAKEKEALKQAERDSRRQLKKEEKQRRGSDAHTRPERRGRSTSDEVFDKSSTPRPSIGGRQYSDHQHAHTRALPAYVTTVDQEKYGMGAQPQITKSRAAKGRWLRFVTWFRTRLLRISRGLHLS